MKTVRKLLALGLAASLSLLTACGGNTGGQQSPSPSAPGSAAPGTAWTSAKDLEGKKIAVQEGTTGDLLATDIPGTTVTRFKAPTAAAMELINGRVDAVVIDKIPAGKLAEANPDKLMLLPFAASEETEAYAIAVQKGNTDLLSKLDAAIAVLRENGTYDAVFAKFISGEEVSLPQIPAYTASGKLVMGTNAEFEPFEYRDDDNHITGFDAELARYIAAELGMELEIVDQDFDSLIPTLQAGKVDFVAAGMTANDERRANVDFTADYYESTQAIIVLK
jgi:ABC-type amino acid transport substrate-binding protein